MSILRTSLKPRGFEGKEKKEIMLPSKEEFVATILRMSQNRTKTINFDDLDDYSEYYAYSADRFAKYLRNLGKAANMLSGTLDRKAEMERRFRRNESIQGI